MVVLRFSFLGAVDDVLDCVRSLYISREDEITRILLYVYKAYLKYVKNYLKILPLKLRFPLYYELKIAFVIWLLSPYTRGASLIYRKFLHPLLSSKEREIDEYIVQAKERGYETMVNFGKQGLNLAATAAVTAAVKGQGAITEKLRSFSMHDLTAIPDDEPIGQRHYQTLPATKKKSKSSVPNEPNIGYGIPIKRDSEDDKTDEEREGTYSEDEMFAQRGLRRTQSMKSVKTIKGRKEASKLLWKLRELHYAQVRYGSLKYKVKRRP
ncbi:Receptor expression-enhancing protein 3, partial [Ophiophagus hannah]